MPVRLAPMPRQHHHHAPVSLAATLGVTAAPFYLIDLVPEHG
jgi:hypothetical protein